MKVVAELANIYCAFQLLMNEYTLFSKDCSMYLNISGGNKSAQDIAEIIHANISGEFGF